MSEAYKQAGVDIHAGYEAVERMKKHVQRTMRPEVLTGLGGFGALFELPIHKYKQPVLVSGTDGVGTKLKLAFALDRHDTIGIDAVAMCVNDIVVQGAEPLYFLDYLACGKVFPEQIEAIVKGISDGCEQAGCALIGGETAEMPGFYSEGEYDIAGFSVGIVDKDKIIDGSTISPGDLLIGLPSSGIHSNGFSLVRRVLLEQEGLDLHSVMEEDKSLGEVLLTPTRIYVKPVLELLERFTVKGMAHITGGGFYENIPRMLPEQCDAEVDVGSWPIPSIFNTIQEKGSISQQDMFSTFNMGIGLVMAVKNEEAIDIIQFLDSLGEAAYLIGRVCEGSKEVRLGGVTL
ncbi:phosphoribosylformylglycinamidine cyclo-ligase [Caldalkalibacillus mannanilyticus]|uniref:phosphoribosylformylglycinamidine cyclo-ligase n=1 Tax=Caldalkalibacillus mannanilyticus TaxID=1418 RepID=UPI00046A1211|nr:phosphoribosylformylglycinamidine cyclo-ligase [Caldalkalibacillus mannanilyticus]